MVGSRKQPPPKEFISGTTETCLTVARPGGVRLTAIKIDDKILKG